MDTQKRHLRKAANISRQGDQPGFTLIEVVLVLAIGGLIFLLAFMAFSQVQSNRRDNQRRTDARRLLAYIEEYATDNNGVYPCTATFANNLGVPFSARTRATGALANSCGMKPLLDTDSQFNITPSLDYNGNSAAMNGYRGPNDTNWYLVIDNTNAIANNLHVGMMWAFIGVRCSGETPEAVASSKTWAVRVKLENGRTFCVGNTTV